MATSSKKTAARKPGRKPKKTGEHLAQYAQLRTLLDSLEIGALRYYLDGTSPAEKNERFKRLNDELKPIIERLWFGRPLARGCPDGYTNCGGACVPYACP